MPICQVIQCSLPKKDTAHGAAGNDESIDGELTLVASIGEYLNHHTSLLPFPILGSSRQEVI